MFKNLEETSRTLICVSLLLAAVFGALAMFLLKDNAQYVSNPDYKALIGGKWQFLAGLVLGVSFTVLKIIMIDRGCKKILEMEEAGGKLYGMGQYFLRFFLTAAVLLVAMLMPQIGFLGCVFGVLTLQFAGYITPLWEKRKGAGFNANKNI